MIGFTPAFERLVEHFRLLPGIGYKTAVRMAFHVLDLTDEQLEELLTVDKETWRKELEGIKEWYSKFDHLPTELTDNLAKLEEDLKRVQESLNDLKSEYGTSPKITTDYSTGRTIYNF